MPSSQPLARIEIDLQSGDVVSARKRLNRLTRTGQTQKLPPSLVANLFWRVGWPKRGLRHLSRKIVEPNQQILKSHPKEAAEYAACLIRLGAFEDAKSILKIPEVSAETQSRLYLGFAHLESWDYAQAIPCFERYVKTQKLKPYSKLVGFANLACSLVYEREHKAAQPILIRLLHDSQVGKNIFLLGYVLEGVAANAILAGKASTADRYLCEAEARWKEVEGPDKLYLEKWRAIFQLLSKTNSASIAAIEKVKIKAQTQFQWETVRDCDRYLAIATQDNNLFLKVYFGTPFEAFRNRLKKDFGSSVAIPKQYEWKLENTGKITSHNDCLVNPQTRKTMGLSGQNLALLSVLAKDFYRAHRLGTIFGWMYPEEHYHYSSTPRRIHEAVRRLSLWLKDNKLPLTVEELNSSYRLVATKSIALSIAAPDTQTTQWGPLIQRLRGHFAEKEFAIREAEKVIDIPRRTLIRQLQNLVASNHLIRTGTGVGTRYRVPTPK